MTGALQLEVGAKIAAKIFQVPCKEIEKLRSDGFGLAKIFMIFIGDFMIFIRDFMI